MACKGAKEVMGMGFIAMEKCKACGGVGHVPDMEDAEIDAILQTKSVAETSEADSLLDKPTAEQILEELVEPKPVPNTRKKSDRGSKAKA